MPECREIICFLFQTQYMITDNNHSGVVDCDGIWSIEIILWPPFLKGTILQFPVATNDQHIFLQNVSYMYAWPDYYQSSVWQTNTLWPRILSCQLSHCGWMAHICVSKRSHHWFRQWLVAWSAPSYYLNQFWYIANWNRRNKLRWNINRKAYIYIQELHLVMSSGKWRPFCLGLDALTATKTLLSTSVIRKSVLWDTWLGTAHNIDPCRATPIKGARYSSLETNRITVPRNRTLYELQ